MALFLSTYLNKVDKKGRVSVPSQFRSSINKEDFQGIVIYKSIIHNCLEGCAMSRIERISESIDSLDPLSEERDAFATSILGSCIQLSFDNDGRVVLPKSIIEEVGIEENIIFVGKGQTFEMWHPKEFDGHLAAAKKIAMEKRNLLRLTQPTSNQ